MFAAQGGGLERTTSAPLLAWLTKHHLEDYHDLLKQEHYDNVVHLVAATPENLDSLARRINMHPPHLQTLKYAIGLEHQHRGPS